VRVNHARTTAIGVLSFAVVAGLGQLQQSVASPQRVDSGSQDAPNAIKAEPDELPNALEDKRRDLREQAIADVLSGRAKVETRGTSKVVKVGKEVTTSAARRRPVRPRRRCRVRFSTSSSRGRRPTRSSSS